MLKNILLPKYREYEKNVFNYREWKMRKDLEEKLPADFIFLSKLANDSSKIIFF